MGSIGETVQLQFQDPVVVKLSDEERKSGRMNEENVAAAVIAFHRDGFVLLENVVDPAHCDTLDAEMCLEAERMAKDPKTIWNDNLHAPKEKRSGNMQHAPPLRPEVMYEDIWANKLTATILSSILGPNPSCNFADGNTALSGGYGGRQTVHADMAYNFPGMPCTITANYYLEDASATNGSTELWLGSARYSTFRDHKACRVAGPEDDVSKPTKISLQTEDDNYAMEANFGVRLDVLEARRKIAPPVQPKVKKGGVMLRDLRLWHAGIANPSPKTRIMLNFIYTPWWYKCPTKVNLPEKARPLAESWANRKDHPIVLQTRYFPTEAECKAQQFGIDFSSRNPSYWKSLDTSLIAGYTFIDE
ncbi:hypothetical protein LTR78_008870 [Recurvomyces mirabilis]|uniref:Phytanoyl-CoA dioxygenase n=1 Tax=Recurvomyces mirabilis TaxID=574656 RepID=A0AAE0TPS4_9PEZI|nr:hypothetical protein LTR78_008870 [Recurvomyces mirabilis]KAK5155785.1 hypothetical protein LTS14_005351 [Recurvomyces mirabilis]